jgi:hypothetical protein
VHVHTLSHSHTLILTLTHSHTLTHTLSHSHSRTLSYSHSHTLILTLTHSHTHTHAHSHTLILSLTQSHTLTHTHTLSYSHSHTLILTLTHSHTHTHTSTLMYKHIYMYMCGTAIILFINVPLFVKLIWLYIIKPHNSARSFQEWQDARKSSDSLEVLPAVTMFSFVCYMTLDHQVIGSRCFEET